MVAARGAGIRVVMITGDYLLTAIAIAKNVARWQGRGVVKLDEAGNQLVEFDWSSIWWIKGCRILQVWRII